MNNSSLCIHGITKVEIEENDGAEGSHWRHIVFTSDEESKFTVSVFPPRPTTNVPVSFVRENLLNKKE